jgi:adenylosuccinate lyase
MSHDTYENPLITRYASDEMSEIFSMQRRIAAWRKLWIILAESENELGLPVSKDQIKVRSKK